MRTWPASIAACALAGVLSCHGSSAGEPPSGEDVTCGPSMYIFEGGCLKLPEFSDAGGPYDDGADAASDAPGADSNAAEMPDAADGGNADAADAG